MIQADPLSGHLFVFRNKPATYLKILVWDRSGYCLWYKRLERGVFAFPPAATTHLEIDAADLLLLLDRIELSSARRRPRFTLRRGSGP